MGAWSGVLVVVAALAMATAGGTVLKRRSGNFRTVTSTKPTATSTTPTAQSSALADLGVTGDDPVTLVQFSSAFCAPCRTTRVLCADVAAVVPGVRHLEVDAESHLEAVRALEVWKTPTVLIVDAEGRIRRRASGAPTRSQLLAALAAVLPAEGLDPA